MPCCLSCFERTYIGTLVARGETLHPVLCMATTVARSADNTSFVVVCGQADGTVVTVCGYEGSSFLWGHRLGCPFVPHCLVAVHEALVFCAGRALSGVLLGGVTNASVGCTKDETLPESCYSFKAVSQPIKLPSWISAAALASLQAPPPETAGDQSGKHSTKAPDMAHRCLDRDWSLVGLFDDGHLYVLEYRRRGAPRNRAASAGSGAVVGENQSATAAAAAAH